MGPPAVGNHLPVRLVSVHRYLHSAAAGGDLYVKAAVAEGGEEVLERVDVVKSRGLADVSAVKKYVNADGVNALFLCLGYHRLQVVDVGVNVSVGEKTEEVKNGIVGLNVPDDLLPCVGSKHLSGFDRLGDELCALSKDLTGTESVVTDLGVAHIVIGGKPDGSAVSLERYMRIFCHKHIEGRGVSCRNSISFARGSYADSVHDYREKRSLHAAEMRIFLENLVHCNVRFSGVFSVLGNLQPAARRNHRPSLYNTYYKPQL